MSAIDTLDITVLTDYLNQHIPAFGSLSSAEKFSGGQSNPTFLLTADSGRYVLRRQPPGKLLPSAHAVDREYRVLSSLKDTDVPVAKALHLCEDTSIIGSMFYVMEFLDGQVFWNPALPELQDDKRANIFTQMSEVLAAIHSVDLSAVGLLDYGKAGNYFERQIGRWTKQYKASEIETIKEMDQLIQWLETHTPADDGKVSLVHGDYRLDNVMFNHGHDQIIAVLDWELSTLGHPYADLAYQCMTLRLPGGIGNMSGLMGLNRAELNIPSEQEYIARYCERMNIDSIPNWSFYLAFSFFRLAAIAQGVAKRAQSGNASNKEAAKVGSFVQPLAQMALQVIHSE